LPALAQVGQGDAGSEVVHRARSRQEPLDHCGRFVRLIRSCQEQSEHAGSHRAVRRVACFRLQFDGATAFALRLIVSSEISIEQTEPGMTRSRRVSNPAPADANLACSFATQPHQLLAGARSVTFVPRPGALSM
jgi:hypothetical protein